MVSGEWYVDKDGFAKDLAAIRQDVVNVLGEGIFERPARPRILTEHSQFKKPRHLHVVRDGDTE